MANRIMAVWWFVQRLLYCGRGCDFVRVVVGLLSRLGRDEACCFRECYVNGFRTLYVRFVGSSKDLWLFGGRVVCRNECDEQTRMLGRLM